MIAAKTFNETSENQHHLKIIHHCHKTTNILNLYIIKQTHNNKYNNK